MSKRLVEKDLFAFTLDHFESLTDLLKCTEYAYNNFEYHEYENLIHNSFSITFEKEDWCSVFSFYFKKDGVFKIGLRTCGIDINEEFYSSKCLYFKFLQNDYVHKNLNQMVAVWINLVSKHKMVEYCENILKEYILYKEKIVVYLQLIDLGSRFRNKSFMRRLPFEVRKKIYETVVKRFCGGHVLECKAFTEKIFP